MSMMGDPGPGLDTDVGTLDDVQTLDQGGHMAVEGELHHDRRCHYVRYKSKVPLKTGTNTVYAYTLRQACWCETRNEQPIEKRAEMHFSSRCEWKRIEDTVLQSNNQNVYLYRKCRCYIPETYDVTYRAPNQ